MIKKLLANGFKMEVEAMIFKERSYIAEEFVPMKHAERKLRLA